MKILSSILLSFLFLTNFSFSQNNVESAVKSFAGKTGMEHASISIHVIDLSDGSVVAKYNPERTLPTASTAKLFSTGTALDILGPKHKSETRIYIDGDVDSNGVLNGNIWIRGGGDASIGSKYFNKEGHQLDFFTKWISAIQEAGIKEISGGVIADASEFGYEGAPGGWSWSDMGNYYGAAPSGLTIYDNLLRYTFSTSSVAGNPTTIKSIEPYVPGMTFHNYVLSSKKSGDNAYLFGAPYSNDFFGTGTLPINRSSFLVKGSLPDPEMQFAYEFNKAIADSGIKIYELPSTARDKEIKSTTSDYEKRTLLHSTKGKSLSVMIKETNYRSVNLFAEHMINMIGYEKTGNGSTTSGLNVLAKYWAGKMNTSGLQINDGSGLSRNNAISSHHFTQFLSYMHKSKYAVDFKASLPIAGVSGTLRNVCKGQAGQNRVVAKSGSMTRIKSYAGYVTTKSDKKLAFAIIVNNNTCTSGTLKVRIEAVLNAMANY
jgi:D-alanyl-D-alanine carboxypeptidase/D-alanyl-D-alanine-endopeptidase (penicillin-binding protein 4)